MSRYRGGDDRNDDVYETRRGRTRSYAEERFNESQRGDYDRNSMATGERQFDYRNLDESVGQRGGGRAIGGQHDPDDYGRESIYGGGARADYTGESGAVGRPSYGRSDYGQQPRGYGEERNYDEGRGYAGGGGGRREEVRRGSSRSHVRCRDIMTRDVTVATRQSTLQEVAQMMRDEDTGVIPVVEPQDAVVRDGATDDARPRANATGNGKLVGLITDRDVVIRAIAEGKDSVTTLAEEIMTKDVYTAQPNDRVIDAIRKMGDKQVRRIPIVDRDGSLRGIISMADVALETEEDSELARALEEISSGASFWSKIFG